MASTTEISSCILYSLQSQSMISAIVFSSKEKAYFRDNALSCITKLCYFICVALIYLAEVLNKVIVTLNRLLHLDCCYTSMEFPTEPKDRYNPLQTDIQQYGSHPHPVTQSKPSILFALASHP